MSFAKWSRVLHRWGAVLIAVPLLLVLTTGLLLLLKKQLTWVQPPTQAGTTSVLAIGFDDVLDICRAVPELQVDSWDDVDRIDARPDLGLIKLRAHNRCEIQIDASTGEVLQVAYRRSDLIESLHDGTFFHERAKFLVFLPAALILLGMWGTGLYMFFRPYLARRRRRASTGTKA